MRDNLQPAKNRGSHPPNGAFVAPVSNAGTIGASHAAALLAATISLVVVGCCSQCYLASRTLVGEPSRYSIRIDRKRSLTLYRSWAEREWQHAAGSCAATAELETDYHAGFVAGFVDFVYGGGSGEPSPVPPREYWNVATRSPDGKERVQQWFAGYRHGSRVADTGGYRQAGTVQLSLADQPELGAGQWPSRARPAMPVEPIEEVLPPPGGTPTPAPDLNAPPPALLPPETRPTNPFEDQTTLPSTNPHSSESWDSSEQRARPTGSEVRNVAEDLLLSEPALPPETNSETAQPPAPPPGKKHTEFVGAAEGVPLDLGAIVARRAAALSAEFLRRARPRSSLPLAAGARLPGEGSQRQSAA